MILRQLSILTILVGALGVGCSGSSTAEVGALSDVRLPTLALGSPAQFGEFGRSVAFFGDLIAIGAPDEGRVHLYRGGDGAFLRSIESPAGRGTEFGAALAAWGRDLLIGAPGVGRVYLLDGITGEFRLTFEPGDDEPIGEFGAALTVVGAQAWVGAPGREGATGEVFRFALPGGALLGRIASPVPEVGGAFGGALATNGARGVIGAVGQESVFVYDEEGLLLRTFVVPDGEGDIEGFGAAVAINGEAVVVGAPDASGRGQAFVFDFETTVLLNKLDAPPGNTRFGLAVGLDGDDAVIAAAGDGPQVHMYDALSGVLRGSVASRTESGSPAGLAVAVDKGIALVGAYLLPGAPRGLAQAVNCAQASVVFDLEAPSPTEGAAYGNAVTYVDGGNRIVVGEPGHNNGEIHVYDGTGMFLRSIVAPTGAQLFGHALDDIDGSRVVVGAPGFDAATLTDEGAAYIVNIETGTIEQTLRSAAPQQSGRFGFAVAADGSTVAVGAPSEAPSEGNLGRAYTFDNSGNLLDEFDFDGQEFGDLEFGFAVALGGGSLIVGAPGTFGDVGVVQVFDLQESTFIEQLNAPGGENNDRFGSSLAYLDRPGTPELWVGSPNADAFNPSTQITTFGAGVVSVFETSEWGKVVDLISADPENGGEFGFSLDEDNQSDFVAVGAPGERRDPQPPVLGGPPPSAHGVLHLYNGVSRIREQRLLSSEPEAGGRFGHDVALVSVRVAGGAIHETATGGATPVANAGRVTVHDWRRVRPFYSNAPQDFGRFGECIARVDFDTVMVGEPGANGGEGRAQLVNTTTGATELVFNAVLQSGSGFGATVAVTNTSLFVVGQPTDDTVYVFNVSGALVAEITTPNQGTGTFGASIATIGSDILIGAPGEDDDDGVAYLYTSGGSLLQTYRPDVSGLGGSFGFRVASLTGDVLISAPGQTTGDMQDDRIGEVFVFDTDNNQLNAFFSPDLGPVAFGFSIGSYLGDVLVGSLAGGRVWVIDRDNGEALLQIDAPSGAASFGTSVAQIGIGQIAVGGGGVAPGQGFLFDFEGNLLMTYDSPNPNPLGGNFGNKVIDMDGAPMFSASTENVNPVLAGRVYLFGAIGQSPPPEPGPGAEYTLESPNPVSGDEFGFSVAFAAFDIVAGAPGASNGEGLLFVFDGFDGEFDDTASSPNAIAGGRFTHSLATNAKLGAIGAPGETGGALQSGRAYLVSSVNGNLLLSFVSKFPEVGGGFGTSVAVAAANVAVGAPFENVDGTTDAGRVHYFDCIIPNALSEFTSPNPVANGNFGASVAARGFDVYVGAPGEAPFQLVGDTSPGSGRAYCFNGLTGNLKATFNNPNPEGGSNFGAKIVMLGDNILVSAPNASVGQVPDAGRVYLINVATGVVLQTFESDFPQSGDRFGASVATDGTSVFVGAPGTNDDEGIVYQFNAAGQVVETFSNPNPESGAEFGHALAAVADNGLVGAPGQTVGGVEAAGAAYVNPEADDRR